MRLGHGWEKRMRHYESVGSADRPRGNQRTYCSGVATAVHEGAVNCELIAKHAGGSEVAASITKESVKLLGLQPGSRSARLLRHRMSW